MGLGQRRRSREAGLMVGWLSLRRRSASLPVFRSLRERVTVSCLPTISQERRGGLMVGWWLLRRRSASLPVFRSLPRAGHFLLRAQEKVTKEKGTPQTCPPGLLPCGSVGRDRGSSTAHPVLTTNARASLPAPLRAFRPRPTTSDGTPERASCAQKIKQKQKRRRLRPASALSLPLSIQVLLSSTSARSAGSPALVLALA
jgi:hypothetical protein